MSDELHRIEEANSAKGLKKVALFMGLMGPAWLAIALNIGGATVTTSAVLGSKTGFKFLWAMIPEIFAIWVMCILFVRLSIVTGLGPVAAARKYLGKAAGWITAVSVFIVNIVFHALMYALIGAAVAAIFGVDPRLAAAIGFGFVLIIVFSPRKASYIRAIETVLRVLVWVLLASFVVVLFMVKIDWGGFLRGFIPSMPAGSGEAISLIGVLGAAIAINVPVLAAYGATQRKWRHQSRQLSVFELTYTNVILLIVQFVIIMVFGSTLFLTGDVPGGAIGAAKALEPFAGRASVYLFGIGLLGAVFTSMVSQVLISGFLISDVFGWEVDASSTRFKISELVVTFLGFSAPLFGWNAFSIVVYGSGFNITFAPVLVVFWLVMANRDSVMSQLKARPWLNVSVIIGTAIALVSTVRYWVGIFGG